jgi:catechol 2,3-dioxygenase-like lactoylglutathione lyase family enzyme
MTDTMSPSFLSTRDVILRTERFDEAVRFYETVIGFRVTLRREGLVGFETGSFQFFVERGAPAHGPVFEMRVPNVDSAKKTLSSAGCSLVEENPSRPRCYMRDPFGLVFNLDNG